MNVRNWWKFGSQQRQLCAGLITSLRHKWTPPPEVLGYVVILMLLALSLTGCAHNSSVPCPEQKLPPAPALSEPMPATSYSLSVQTLFQKWQEKLIDTPMMQKP